MIYVTNGTDTTDAPDRTVVIGATVANDVADVTGVIGVIDMYGQVGQA